jgi:hypothetical protein
MVIIGRVIPVLEADVFGEGVDSSHNFLMKKPFGLMFEALEDIKENEGYFCAGSSHKYAFWGGLVSIRTQKPYCACIFQGYQPDIRNGVPGFFNRHL